MELPRQTFDRVPAGRLRLILLVLGVALAISAALSRLNEQCVDAFMTANVQWYEEHVVDASSASSRAAPCSTNRRSSEDAAKKPDVL